MGKRGAESQGGNKNKKYKQSGFIDPNTSGVYATCNRGREAGCRKELMNLLSTKCEEWYPDWEKSVGDETEQDEKEFSVEDQIKQELASLKKEKSAKTTLFLPIDLGCECLVFIKIRKPVEPAEFIRRICKEALQLREKQTRLTQKLTPITYSVSASIDELKKLAHMVLEPHFHQKEGQKALKFAIQVTRRNFNTLEKDDIIKTIATCVGHEYGHKVDLKNYDKLILVECFKNNVGMSVVSEYFPLEKFNLQQIFEKNMKENEASRVNPTKSENSNGESDEKKATLSDEDAKDTVRK